MNPVSAAGFGLALLLQKNPSFPRSQISPSQIEALQRCSPPVFATMYRCFCSLRLQLIPLLQELAGGARALDTRLEELSRQSLFAREMLEREALRWERQHLNAVGSSGAESSGQSDHVEEEESKVPPLGCVRRRDEFPLSAFLKTEDGSTGEDSEQRRAGADLPELVREELLHRFVMGKLPEQVVSLP